MTAARLFWTNAFRPMLRLQMRAMMFVAAFLALVLASGRNVERIGDGLQVLLPVAALGCAIADGRGVQFFGRYVLLELGIKLPKFMLGDLPMNQRPNGGSAGFPSGHTAAATFGATALAASCMRQTKVTQGVVIASAAFVGGSRVEADKHTVWQALAGGLWGWFVQAAALVAFDRWFRRVWRAAGRGMRQGWRLIARPAHWGILRWCLLAGLALSVARPAVAQPEWSVDVYTGWQTAPHSMVTGNDPLGAGAFDFRAGWEGRSFEAPPHYGIRAILWQGPNWGYWGDFNHTKVYADDATLGAGGTSGGFEVLEFTDGLNALTFGVIRQYPDAWGRLTPYWGVGLGAALPHVEVQTTAASPETTGYQLAGPAASGMAGVVMVLSDRLDGFAEYKFTYSRLDADLDGGGRLKTDVITNGLNFGVRYTFD